MRCYKWSRLLSTWKYPEVQGGDGASVSGEGSHGAGSGGSRPDEFEFFGLRASEARVSVFLIRMLHSSVDPTLGEAPPSMQAALGGLDLPASAQAAMDRLDRGAAAEQALARRKAAEESARRGTLGGGRMSDVSKRRQQQALLSPRKPRPPLNNIRPKPQHEYVQLSADLEKRLLDSRQRVGRQLQQRDDAMTLLDRNKKNAAFKN